MRVSSSGPESAVGSRKASTSSRCPLRLVLLVVLSGCQDEVAVHLLEPQAAPLLPSPPIGVASTMDGGMETEADTSVGAESGVPPGELLVHHYDFSGEGGTRVEDIVGGADGELIGGAELNGTGGVVLDGSDDYVNLPNGLISALSSVTVAVWLEWFGGPCWQRIFDFGSSTLGEDAVASAHTSLFVTPASCNGSHVGPVQEHVTSAMFHVRNNAYVAQQADAALPVNERVLLALTIDPNRLTLSVNAAVVAQLLAPLHVSEIEDINNWVGRSQWGHDPMLHARIDDVRIYNRALTERQLQELLTESSSDP